MVINIPDDNVLVIFMISLFVLFYSIQSRNVKKKIKSYYWFTSNVLFLGNRQIYRRGHRRGASKSGAVPPTPECYWGSPHEGHECCGGSLRGRENVSAPGYQVCTSDEESSGPSHTFHGNRERGENETDGECCECFWFFVLSRKWYTCIVSVRDKVDRLCDDTVMFI